MASDDLELADLHVSAWKSGHHTDGDVVEVLTLPEERQVLVMRQALLHASRDGSSHFVDADRPHTKRSLPGTVAVELQRRVEGLTLQWRQPRPALGMALRGLFVRHRGVELTLRWSAWSRDPGPRALVELHDWIVGLHPDP